MKNIIKYTAIFIIGAVAYSVIEILWRGYTHISMALAGGICLIGLYCIEEWLVGIPLLIKCIFGSVYITIVEFNFGCIVNRMMGLGVWDYSDRFLNVMGQVCPLYSVFWFFLCIPAFAVCRGARKFYDKVVEGCKKAEIKD